MTKDAMMWVFGIAFVLFALQSVGTWFQIKDYQRAMKRIRPHGTVGIGQKKGFAGHIVIIACDKDAIITDAEAMEGVSILARFRKKKELLGRTLVGTPVMDLISDFLAMEKSKRRFYRGYIQALEALEKRFFPEEYEERIAAGQILLEERKKRKGLFR